MNLITKNEQTPLLGKKSRSARTGNSLSFRRPHELDRKIVRRRKRRMASQEEEEQSKKKKKRRVGESQRREKLDRLHQFP